MSLGDKLGRTSRAVTRLQDKLKYLEDVLEITGRSDMTRLMAVTFDRYYQSKWNGVFEINLIFDDPKVYALTSVKGTKCSMHVESILNQAHNSSIFMRVRIQGEHFILKCHPKACASRYQSFCSQDKIVTVIEREAEGYKYALGMPDLKDKIIPMHAHGTLVKLNNDSLVETEKEWEVLLLAKGSKLDLLKFIITMDVPLDMVKGLTKESFRLIQTLHRSNMTHGDSKIDQFIWKSENDVGVLGRLCLLDFGRCVIKNDLDEVTWNLRKLADINLMIVLNAFIISQKLDKGLKFSNINMRYVRDNIHEMIKWPDINKLNIKKYLLPDMAIASVGGLVDVDWFSTNYACKLFYAGEDFKFLDTIDTDKFLQYLLEGERIFELSSAIWNLAARAGSNPLTFYEDQLIENHPKNPVKPSPSQPQPYPPAQMPVSGPPSHAVPQPYSPAPVPVPGPPQPHQYIPAPVPVPGPPQPHQYIPAPVPVPVPQSHVVPQPYTLVPGHLPQAVPQEAQPVQQRAVARPLTFRGHQLYSPDGLPYNYFMRRGSVILYDGRNQVFLDVIKCLTIINGGLVQSLPFSKKAGEKS